MVTGIEKFKEHFSGFEGMYSLFRSKPKHGLILKEKGKRGKHRQEKCFKAQA